MTHAPCPGRGTPARTTSAARSASGEEGFVLALVVLLLFAIGVAAATGYQVVRTEARLALQTHEGVQALAIARAGLERFIAEEVGEPSDTVVYALNGGEALVTSRKVYDLTIPDELYVLTSVGTYADPRGQTAPASRTVRQYVVRRGSPMNRLGAVIALSGNIRVDDVANRYSPVVDGNDDSRNNDCEVSQSLRDDLPGIVAVDGITIQDLGDVDGFGGVDSVMYADSASIATALDLPWALLTDASFPVGEFDDAPANWPDFGLIPSDSFPLIRVNGDFSPTPSSSGRGLLIVTGTFSPSFSFTWDGIILANDFDPPRGTGRNPEVEQTFEIYGILALGLGGGAGQGQPIRIREGGQIIYNFCWALEAGKALAHLEPLDGTWSEGM